MRLSSRLQVVSLVAFLAAVFVACADSSWESARRANTVAAYTQFLRDHPQASQAPEARERIAFLRVQSRPSIEGYEEFEASFPGSGLVAELQSHVEPLYLARAREENTAQAYRSFLSRFPDGETAARARGNLVWVEELRDRPTLASLRAFLEQHSTSDFAGEARRTLELLDARRATSFRTMGVRVDIASNVEDAERVRKGFTAMVAKEYRALGIDVVEIPGGELPSPDLEAWLRLDYQEIPAPGTYTGRSMVSDCRVRIFHRDHAEPVWDRKFQSPAQHLTQGGQGRDKTVFGNARYPFWAQFFVPVSTWATSQARIHRVEYDEPLVAVDVRGDRAAVLLASGGIEYLDVASPLEPVVLQRYRHGRDLSKWLGLRVLDGDKVAIYGSNGLELVSFGGLAPKRVGRWETPEIGAVRAADVHGETLLVAGSKGLHAIRFRREALTPHRLLDSDLVGVSVGRGHVYLVSPDRVAVATPKQLLRHLTGTPLSLGEHFVAQRSRLAGDSLWVFGDDRIVEFSLEQPDSPNPITRLDAEQSGIVADLAADGSHLYLVGERGVQVADPRGRAVSDVIQVEADASVVSKGRFLLLAGSQALEVLDISPYAASLANPGE